ncbi:hypothetical protein HRS9139_10400 [Pyrenophora teres f. teres]|uniref:DUF3716 domain containing protein n=1 Tax=Pyrenophora teres f. teres TaxID=97479 RepID=A0A6S6WCR6_9PLEO|nr:hypothetical protein HRS9139_10400 [Pyrenophora teres f. teres]CAE7205168.1 DUF3716 domain containing protein [Pyrenophora teres f. teres]
MSATATPPPAAAPALSAHDDHSDTAPASPVVDERDLPGGVSPRDYAPETPRPHAAQKRKRNEALRFSPEAAPGADSSSDSPSASPTAPLFAPPASRVMASPSRKKTLAGGIGIQSSELYSYPPKASCKEYILGWLTDHRDEVITIGLLKEFQIYLVGLCRSGVLFGPVMFGCVFDIDVNFAIDLEICVQFSIDLQTEGETIGEFFSLVGTSKRAFYESNVNALMQHHSCGMQIHPLSMEEANDLQKPEDAMCGRCASEKYKKKFKSCRTVFCEDSRMLHGSCTNCFFNGGMASCSMTRSSYAQPAAEEDSDVPSGQATSSSVPSMVPVNLRTRSAASNYTAAPAAREYRSDTVVWSKLGSLDLPSDYCSVQDKTFRPHAKLVPFELLKWKDGPSQEMEEANELRTIRLRKIVRKQQLVKRALKIKKDRRERLAWLRANRAAGKRAAEEQSRAAEVAAEPDDEDHSDNELPPALPAESQQDVDMSEHASVGDATKKDTTDMSYFLDHASSPPKTPEPELSEPDVPVPVQTTPPAPMAPADPAQTAPAAGPAVVQPAQSAPPAPALAELPTFAQTAVNKYEKEKARKKEQKKKKKQRQREEKAAAVSE